MSTREDAEDEGDSGEVTPLLDEEGVEIVAELLHELCKKYKRTPHGFHQRPTVQTPSWGSSRCLSEQRLEDDALHLVNVEMALVVLAKLHQRDRFCLLDLVRQQKILDDMRVEQRLIGVCSIALSTSNCN